MNIAIDCRSVFNGMGGIGQATSELVKAMHAVGNGHSFDLMFTERERATPLVSATNVRELTFSAGMIDEPWEQLQLPTILEENDVDLYHGTCFSLPVAKSVSHQVVTVHDVVFRAHPELVDPGLCSYLDRWTEHSLDTADAVITVSEFSRQQISEFYGTPPDKIAVVHNGISSRFSAPSDNHISGQLMEKHRILDGYVLYVGSLEPKKNIDRLLEAYSTLVENERIGGFKLVLVGGRGGMAYDARAAIERTADPERVVVTGPVDDAEVVSWMKGATAFVYPSLHEGFGLPPLEAMACGVPTVVSDSSSLPEVVGDAALIASATDAQALAEEVDRAVNDEDTRMRLAERGPQRAREFTWDAAARKTMDAYEGVAGGAK